VFVARVDGQGLFGRVQGGADFAAGQLHVGLEEQGVGQAAD